MFTINATFGTLVHTLIHLVALNHDICIFRVYNVQCTMYKVQCTMYKVQCTMYSVQGTMYNVQRTIYNVQCTMYNVQLDVFNYEADLLYICIVNTVQLGKVAVIRLYYILYRHNDTMMT